MKKTIPTIGQKNTPTFTSLLALEPAIDIMVIRIDTIKPDRVWSDIPVLKPDNLVKRTNPITGNIMYGEKKVKLYVEV